MKNTNREKLWKISFFSLLTFMIIGFILVFIFFIRLFPPIEENQLLPPLDEREGTNVIFTISTNKEKLNQFIQQKLHKNQASNYDVQLTNSHLLFNSSLSIMGRNVSLEMALIPEVAPNGDLVLHADTFHIGFFELPVEKVLQLIHYSVTLPEWVELYPNERLAHLQMSEVAKQLEGFQFSFVEFDLPANNIELTMSIQ